MRGGSTSDAFIWRKGNGASSLYTFYHRSAIGDPPGWTLNSASLISGDGNTIYGWGFNPDDLIEMFKVTLNAP